jgi:hypothetical protein
VIIFYDWKKILQLTGLNARKIVLALRALNGEVPRNRYDPLYRYYISDLSGASFLVNPGKLIEEDFFYKPREIAEYVGLASFRNYAHYSTSRDTSLDLLHSPVSKHIIEQNRLLRIDNGRIHFLFEEVTGE